MIGEKHLETLLTEIEPVLSDDTYVFVTLPNRELPPNCRPLLVFQEAEGTTLILSEHEAKGLGLSYQFPCRMITLNVHSSLEAVGFIARVAAVLTAQNIGANPVSGYFHDHLFVPLGRENDAMQAIKTLQAV